MKRFFALAALVALVLALPTAASAHRSKHHRSSHGAKSGVVKAFDAATGELTITTNKGREVSGLVTDDTEIECKHHGDRHDGDDDDDAKSSTSGSGRDDDDDDDRGDDDDDRGDDDDDCSTDGLVAGAEIRRARLDFDGDDAVWEKIKLA